MVPSFLFICSLIGLDRSHHFEMRGPPVRGPGVPSIEGSGVHSHEGTPCDLLRRITWGPLN